MTGCKIIIKFLNKCGKLDFMAFKFKTGILYEILIKMEENFKILNKLFI